MNILFIFTGGTIGSTAEGDMISLDKNKSYKLLRKYSELHGIDFDYSTAEPFLTLSENSTGNTLRMLCESVKASLDGEYDGIIVTHGTDSLQYSAAALSYTLGKSCVPVCLVSSNYILENPKSNALDNLHAAINFIKRGKEKGVFVSYKNADDFTHIHRASRLLASNAFDDNFYSVCNSWYGYFDENGKFFKNPEFSEYEDELPPLCSDGLDEQCKSIARIDSYVGMNYPVLEESVKYVIIGGYHSGTVNTFSPAAKSFYKNAAEKGITVYVTGVRKGKFYESSSLFDELNIVPLMNISPISAYIKLWLCQGNNVDINDAMNKSLGGDKW